MSTGALHCGSCVTHDCKPLSNAVFNSLKIISGTEMDKINTVTIKPEVLNEALKLIIENFENRVGRKYKTMNQIN